MGYLVCSYRVLMMMLPKGPMNLAVVYKECQNVYLNSGILRQFTGGYDPALDGQKTYWLQRAEIFDSSSRKLGDRSRQNKEALVFNIEAESKKDIVKTWPCPFFQTCLKYIYM